MKCRVCGADWDNPQSACCLNLIKESKMKTDKPRVIYAREDSTLDVTDVYRKNDMMLNTLFVRLNDHLIAVEQLEQKIKDSNEVWEKLEREFYLKNEQLELELSKLKSEIIPDEQMKNFIQSVSQITAERAALKKDKEQLEQKLAAQESELEILRNIARSAKTAYIADDFNNKVLTSDVSKAQIKIDLEKWNEFRKQQLTKDSK
jgi:hypothetical protein